MTQIWMSMFRQSAPALIVAISLLLTPAEAQTPGCITDSKAALMVKSIRRYYTHPVIDSMLWKQNGFPFATDTAIQLVTSDSICTVAAQAYNVTSNRASTPNAITRAYVIRIGSTGHVVAAPDAPGDSARTEWRVYYWYNPGWIFKQNASR